jgi:hypothetical protein
MIRGHRRGDNLAGTATCVSAVREIVGILAPVLVLGPIGTIVERRPGVPGLASSVAFVARSCGRSRR